MRQVITLGGNAPIPTVGYSIEKFFPAGSVVNFDRPWHGFTKRWCDRVAESIDEPTVVIGFSAGASAALRIASRSDHVTHCFAHSPRDRGDCPRTNCTYKLLITGGDSSWGAGDIDSLADRYSYCLADWQVIELPLVEFEDPTWLESWLLTPLKHQFNNCIPLLKSHRATSHLWEK